MRRVHYDRRELKKRPGWRDVLAEAGNAAWDTVKTLWWWIVTIWS